MKSVWTVVIYAGL